MVFLAQLFVKSLAWILKNIFRRGGETWPGEIVLKIFPWLPQKLNSDFEKIILIVGTNGKTSTTKMTKLLLEQQGFCVISNASGANMLNGIVSNILLQRDFFNKKAYYGVFEVDEYALNEVTQSFKPNFVILLNIFRDQLDRYGEVQNILNRWQRALNESKPEYLIINSSDPGLYYLAEQIAGTKTKYYTVPLSFQTEQTNVLGDYLFCPSCQQRLQYKSYYVGHLGQWHCPKCHLEPGVSFTFPNQLIAELIHLPSYLVINAQAIYLLTQLLKINPNSLYPLLRKWVPAFGRGEKLDYQGQTVSLHLGKNPASWTVAFNYMTKQADPDSLYFFGLNNRVPDGHDVSWIWDINISQKSKVKSQKVFVFGDRGYDLAIRLQSEGFHIVKVFQTAEQALKEIKSSKKSLVSILANYSSMLEIREQITGRAIL